MVLKYAFLMEFINLCDVQEEKIFFSINRLYRVKIARKNRDIRRRRNVFLSEPNISDRISTDSRARIRETGELLNTRNAKEQLVGGYERGENRGKRYVGRFWIEIKIGFCERIRHFTLAHLSRAVMLLVRERERERS